MSLAARWTQELDTLRELGRYRQLRSPSGIDFTSNDYLGLGRRCWPESIHPLSGMASRALGHHPVWDEVESKLAAWHGAEAALVMTSGYTANEGLLATVVEPGDWVGFDDLSHACILDGLRLVRPRKYPFRHNDLNHLEDGLKAEHHRIGPPRERFIVTESLFSMDGDCPNLVALVELAERYAAQVIIDEAHATGCFGTTGSGLIDAAGLRSRVLATVHTGGKALGVSGAYIAGSQLLRDWLINRCRHFLFTTALPASVGSNWLEMLKVVPDAGELRGQLKRNGSRFRERVSGLGTEQIVPIILGGDADAVRAALGLQTRGFDVRAIRPPTVPVGTARIRVAIHASHTAEQLDSLTEAIREVVN